MLYVVLAGISIVFLLPLEVAFVTSLKSGVAVGRTLPFLPPGLEGLTFQNWTRAFELLKQGLVNSLILVVPVTIISAGMGSLAAYGLTRTDWRGQVPILLLIVAGVFLPTQAAIVPLSRFWSIYVPLEQILAPVWQLPLLHEYHSDLLALMITDIAFGLPICTVLFRSYYKGLSDEMVEAAMVDGASLFSIYRRIIFPLSGPMFAVTLIYQFTQVWNSFLFPLIIMVSSNNPAAPVTLSLAGIGASLEGTNYGLRMAGALLTALPTLIVFLLFGERFAEGVVGRT
ncbi:carbohydrate ABC transporter permease [Halococcus dombrowskii]